MQNSIAKFSIQSLLNDTNKSENNTNLNLCEHDDECKYQSTESLSDVSDNNNTDENIDKNKTDIMKMLLTSQLALYQSYLSNFLMNHEKQSVEIVDQKLITKAPIEQDLPLFPKRIGHPYQNRNPPKRKKPRTSFNRVQLIELEKRFLKQKYLASSERSSLAHIIKMSDSQVKTWFQNRRTKWRRQTIEQREAERQAANRLILSITHQKQHIQVGNLNSKTDELTKDEYSKDSITCSSVDN